MDRRIGFLEGALEIDLDGMRQAGVDLGQHAQGKLVADGQEHWLILEVCQEHIEVMQDRAGSSLRDLELLQGARVFRGEGIGCR
jgi:hypothetical protein